MTFLPGCWILSAEKEKWHESQKVTIFRMRFGSALGRMVGIFLSCLSDNGAGNGRAKTPGVFGRSCALFGKCFAATMEAAARRMAAFSGRLDSRHRQLHMAAQQSSRHTNFSAANACIPAPDRGDAFAAPNLNRYFGKVPAASEAKAIDNSAAHGSGWRNQQNRAAI
jgi:hypothetical protein